MQAEGKLFFHGMPYCTRAILFDEFRNGCRAEELNRLLEWRPIRTEFKGGFNGWRTLQHLECIIICSNGMELCELWSNNQAYWGGQPRLSVFNALKRRIAEGRRCELSAVAAAGVAPRAVVVHGHLIALPLRQYPSVQRILAAAADT